VGSFDLQIILVDEETPNRLNDSCSLPKGLPPPVEKGAGHHEVIRIELAQAVDTWNDGILEEWNIGKTC
jgi:hypothetical protein